MPLVFGVMLAFSSFNLKKKKKHWDYQIISAILRIEQEDAAETMCP